ncbi:MAG TPA: transposase [Terriglobia bacterium]|nr:transposase [Terriglobia bacterium]
MCTKRWRCTAAGAGVDCDPDRAASRPPRALRRGFEVLGPEVVKGLRFVCSDLWKPYLNILAAEAGQALHVLDRFHITTHLNQAVDQVRRSETARLRAEGQRRTRASRAGLKPGAT